jgi:hypothetical protein
MNTARLGQDLYKERKSAAVLAPERTGLYDAATDNLGMVTAYLSDGDRFLSSGDSVNALAAYCYAFGWLHCGAACGLISLIHTACPFTGPIGPLPVHVQGQLGEKTHRYFRLLTTASGSVRPAAEAGTAFSRTADRVSMVTAVYKGQGERFLAEGVFTDALACFSYGHGWLDAGVRAGLFSILSDRHLFTV